MYIHRLGAYTVPSEHQGKATPGMGIKGKDLRPRLLALLLADHVCAGASSQSLYRRVPGSGGNCSSGILLD